VPSPSSDTPVAASDASAELEFLDDSAPEQTPAEAAEAAEFELPGAALEPASRSEPEAAAEDL